MSLGVVNLNLLEVKPSKIHGMGAFAKTSIPEGTVMGPYKGRYMTAEERAHVDDGAYIWKINENRFVDAKFSQKNNPLRYINGAKTKSQKKKVNCEMRNVGKFPCCEKVYYVTTKNVPAVEELIIDYGPYYFK